MKYFWLSVESIADEPLEALGGKTPLEFAKTPVLDELVKRSALASAVWTPKALPPTPEVAAFSMLGYDPREYYTGVAPLEASARGLDLKDSSVAFRADFVAVSDGVLVDPTVKLSKAESEVLLKDIRAAWKDPKIELESLGGHKNLLLIHDAAFIEDLDDVECISPQGANGEKISTGMPKGKAASALNAWMVKTKEVLENHDVNRVRIDLGENPASMLWFWGQGRRPKLPYFTDRTGKEGGAWTMTESCQGLARLAGLKTLASLEKESFVDFNWIQISAGTSVREDYKAKIRRIEEFDSKILGKLLKELEVLGEPFRLLVTTDVVRSSTTGQAIHGAVPLMWTQDGSQGAVEFSEKNCAQSGMFVDPGAAFMQTFLKV